MRVLSRSDFKILARHRGPGCISMYLPCASPIGRSVRDSTQLETLLVTAKSAVAARNCDPEILRRIFEPLRRIVREPGRLRSGTRSLVVFADRERSRFFSLPIRTEAYFGVARRFTMKPLIPLLATGGRHFVAAIGRSHIRLWEASQTSLRRLWRYRRIRRSASESSGETAPSEREAGSAAVETLFGRGQELLVVVADGSDLTDCRNNGRFQDHVSAFVRADPDRLAEDDLAQHAWRASHGVVSRRIERDTRRTGARLVGNGAVQKVADIIEAASDGRVESLFAAHGAERWGRVAPNGRGAVVHGPPEPTDEDLIARAAVDTLMHDGRVFLVASAAVPSRNGSPVAAVLRDDR